MHAEPEGRYFSALEKILDKCLESNVINSEDKLVLKAEKKRWKQKYMKMFFYNTALFMFLTVTEHYMNSSIWYSCIIIIPIMLMIHLIKYYMEHDVAAMVEPYCNLMNVMEHLSDQFENIHTYYIRQHHQLRHLRATNAYEKWLNPTLTHQEKEFNCMLTHILSKNILLMNEISNLVQWIPKSLVSPYFNLVQANEPYHLLLSEVNIDYIAPNFDNYFKMHRAMISYFMTVIALNIMNVVKNGESEDFKIYDKMQYFNHNTRSCINVVQRKFDFLMLRVNQRLLANTIDDEDGGSDFSTVSEASDD